jgi:hypothetical protein
MVLAPEHKTTSGPRSAPSDLGPFRWRRQRAAGISRITTDANEEAAN